MFHAANLEHSENKVINLLDHTDDFKSFKMRKIKMLHNQIASNL
jgi:hypothetical protein